MQAAQWFDEDRANAQIAAELRVGPRRVEKWRRGGPEALRSRGPHRRPRLDQAAFARLEAELNLGPAAHGYADDQRWTLGRVAALIKTLSGIDYTLPGVSLPLRRNGWSVQVPFPERPRHRARRPGHRSVEAAGVAAGGSTAGDLGA